MCRGIPITSVQLCLIYCVTMSCIMSRLFLKTCVFVHITFLLWKLYEINFETAIQFVYLVIHTSHRYADVSKLLEVIIFPLYTWDYTLHSLQCDGGIHRIKGGKCVQSYGGCLGLISSCTYSWKTTMLWRLFTSFATLLCADLLADKNLILLSQS